MLRGQELRSSLGGCFLIGTRKVSDGTASNKVRQSELRHTFNKTVLVWTRFESLSQAVGDLLALEFMLRGLKCSVYNLVSDCSQ